MSLRDLTIALGMTVDDAQLDAADKKLADLVKSAKEASTKTPDGGGSGDVGGSEGKELGSVFDDAKKALMGFLAVSAAKEAFGWIEGMISGGAALDDLSQKLGVGTDALQQLQFAGEMAGVETESMNSAIGFLQKNMGLAANGSDEAAKSFKELGVDYKDADGKIRPITSVFEDISDAMADTGSEAEMAGKLVKVFGKSGAALIPVMKDGSKGLRTAYDDFARLGGGMDKDFIKKAAEADDELTRTKFAVKGMASTLAVALIPSLSKSAHFITDVVAKIRDLTRHSEIVKGTLMALGAAATIGGIAKAAPYAISAAKGMRAMYQAATAAKTAGGALSAVFSSGFGVVAAVAGIALLVALFEDLYQLMSGGESVIGEVLDSLGGAGTAAEFANQLRDAWAQVMQAVQDVLPSLKDVGATIMQTIVAALPYLVQGFVHAIKFGAALALAISGVVTTLKEMLGLLSDAYKIVAKGGSLKELGAVFDKRTSAAGTAIDKVGNGIFGKDQSFVNAKTGEVTTRSVGGLYGDTNKELNAALSGQGIELDPQAAIMRARASASVGILSAPSVPVGANTVLAPTISQGITMPITIVTADPQGAADAIVAKKGAIADNRAMRDAFNAASGAK